MKDELAMERLESDLIYSIKKFQMYAEMRPVDRNNYIASLLENVLVEIKKLQLSESQLSPCNYGTPGTP